MFFPQTLSEYLDNPMGKGSTAITGRKLIQEDLNRRYEKLIKKHKDFKFTVYRNKDDYCFHFLIPSESERQNTYDVVIWFSSEEGSYKFDNFLHRYHMSFFSNCPSFTFTYAYVYNEYELLVPFLKKKYDSIVLKNNPVMRNPGEVLGYEKSIYYACKYIKSHISLQDKGQLKQRSVNFVAKNVYETIRSTDQIIVEIKKENNKLSEEKKKSKEKNEPKKHTTDKMDVKKSISKPTVPKQGRTTKVTPSKKVRAKKSTLTT